MVLPESGTAWAALEELTVACLSSELASAGTGTGPSIANSAMSAAVADTPREKNKCLFPMRAPYRASWAFPKLRQGFIEAT
jgi:hypothetical protein